MRPSHRFVLALTFACIATAVSVRAEDKKDKDPLATRTIEDIRKTLAEINAEPDKGLDATAKEHRLALQRLRAYRYLAGVPYKDVELDDGLSKYALAAAKICDKLGKLDHTPKNPGLPEDEYKVAQKGARSCNLGFGVDKLATAIGGWMSDSDKSNIDRLGHRRWCLNPAMKKVGFGRSGTFVAMSCQDQSRKNVPDFDHVSWPPRGLMPAEYFGARDAWNVSLNPRKYKTPGKGMKVSVYRLKKDGEKDGDALELDYTGTNAIYFGIPNCIIFRPAKLDTGSGKKYRVEIEGLETAKGKAASVAYTVEFCKAKE